MTLEYWKLILGLIKGVPVTAKLRENELPTVTSVHVAVKIQMRNLSYYLQVIAPITKHFQHDILNFLQTWTQKGITSIKHFVQKYRHTLI